MIHAILAALIIYFGVGLVGWSLSGSQPDVTTSLSAGITASEMTIPVASVEGFPSAGSLYIQGEALEYTAKETPCATAPFSGAPACFTGVSRGRQESPAISHPLSARVYSEGVGLTNDLAGFEARTSIDQLGDVTTPWVAGKALIRFLAQNATWDWPMFEGDFAMLRIPGVIMSIGITLGIFYLMASLLFSAISRVF